MDCIKLPIGGSVLQIRATTTTSVMSTRVVAPTITTPTTRMAFRSDFVQLVKVTMVKSMRAQMLQKESMSFLIGKYQIVS